MQEEAELALLDQHLQQTNKLASRMTTILSRLDTRLTRLDKMIAPFGIQPLAKEAKNIDTALAVLSGEKIRVDLNSQDAMPSRGEEGIISRMPEYSTLDEYIGAVDRVLGDIDRLSRSELRSSEGNIKDLCKLIELAGRNLVALFSKFVRDGSSQTADLESLARDGPLPPPKLLPSLPLVLKISTSLFSLPTHTTHRNATSIFHAALQSAENGYASIRREWIITRCFNPMMREFDEVVEGPMSPGRDEETRKVKCKIVTRLIEGTMALMDGERTLWSQVFQHPSSTGLTSIFSSPVNLLSDLLTTQTSIIRKSLSIHTFYALELYQSLLRIQPRWEEACRDWTGDLKALTMIGDASTVLRGVCLRSFPEILVDVKNPPPASRVSDGPSVGVADVTYSTVAYLETLPIYENIVTTLLTSLGDRNWLMGASAPVSSTRSGEDDSIIQHFVTDLLVALSSQLESRSRSMKRPISSIFLLNNLSYIRNNLILSSSSVANDVLGEAGEDELNRAFRDAKQKYLDSWQGLAQLLGLGDRQAAKDGLTTFFNRLEELEGISRQYGLSKQDPNLRDRLRQDVKNIVIPALNAFVEKHTKLDRYMRSTPSEVEDRLAAIFH